MLNRTSDGRQYTLPLIHAADESADRCSATGTAVPIISSKTRTRPASSSRSSVPTKSANGPVRIRTRCPVASPSSNRVRLDSSVRSIRASTIPAGTGIGRSPQVNKDETPTVLRIDNQRSRPRSRMVKRYRGNSGARMVLSWRAWRTVFKASGICVLNRCQCRCIWACASLLGKVWTRNHLSSPSRAKLCLLQGPNVTPCPFFLGLTGSLGRRRQGPRLILVNGPNRGISWPNYGISFGVAEGSQVGVQYSGRGRMPLIPI
jgi:hypothetical protein